MPSSMLSSVCVWGGGLTTSLLHKESRLLSLHAHIGSGLAFPGLRSWLRGDLLPCSSLTVSGFTHPLT